MLRIAVVATLDPSSLQVSTTLGALQGLCCNCPPKLDAKTPSLLLLAMALACVGGALLAQPVGHHNVEPPLFMVVGYNGG